MSMLKNFLKMFYPSRCIFCDKLIGFDEEFMVCDICYKKLTFLDHQVDRTEYCDEVRGVFVYDDMIKHVIQKFKYYHKAYLYKVFAKLMVCSLRDYISGDVIVSVPLHKGREAQRGYNQSGLLAKEISRITNIRYQDVLTRQKNTGALALCDKEQRSLYIKGAFKARDSKSIAQNKVIIIDDVFTTGATINECSKVLKENKAARVEAFVIAKTIL
ncbi:MAG: ComF family protein [Clostridiales bacterium]|nr:ComF family protein [Clostridiales bacterium]